MRVLAPAKINLRLEVHGRRGDGYHLLRSIMAPISLADELTFTPGGAGLELTCDDPHLPVNDDNLIVRAAQALMNETGRTMAWRIHLTKRIPTAAGLGGGSSDAAATLMALRAAMNLALSDERLAELAVQLGADVPFFLHRRACLAEGIGEILSPYEVPAGLPITLIKPSQGLSTPAVYRALNFPLTLRRKLTNLPPSLGSREMVCAWLQNDLEGPAVSLLPQIEEGKRILREAGAGGVLMSGSGPTVFGIFDTHPAAERAGESAKQQGFWAQPCSLM